MSNEKLVLLAKSGNVEAIETLYLQNLNLAKSIYSRGQFPHTTKEDFLQECYFALVVAVKGYKPSKGYSFATYYANAVKWHFWRLYAQDRNKDDLLVIDSPLGDEEGYTMADLIPDETIKFEFEDVETNATLNTTQRYLAKAIEHWYSSGRKGKANKHLEAIQLHYLDGLTLAETGEKLNISASAVRDQIKTAFRYFRTCENNPGVEALRALYIDCVGSLEYRGSLSKFKNSHTSSVEYALLKRERLGVL